MKRFSLYTVIIFLILAAFSCKKKELTILKGNVTDFFSGQKNANVILHISDIDPTNPSLRQNQYNYTTWIKDIPVDSDGNFNLETEDLSDKKYYLVLYNDTIVSPIYVISPFMINNFSVTTKKFRDIQIGIANQNNIYNKANFEITHEPFSISLFFDSTFTDTVFNWKIIPEKSFEIKYILKRNSGEDTTIYSSVFLHFNDTIPYIGIGY